MVLQTQQSKKVHILLNQMRTSGVVLDLSVKVLVTGKHNPLGHEYLHHVEEARVAVQVEGQSIQNQLLLGDQLVLLAVIAYRLPIQSLHLVLVQLLFSVLLLLSRLVAWKLTQKLST